MRTLHLNLKKKWFDLIASGEKKEEYREIKPYWAKRLVRRIVTYHSQYCINYVGYVNEYFEYDTITFRNGYSKGAPMMVVEFKGIEIGKARPLWSDNWQGDVFIIKLGEILTQKL